MERINTNVIVNVTDPTGIIKEDACKDLANVYNLLKAELEEIKKQRTELMVEEASLKDKLKHVIGLLDNLKVEYAKEEFNEIKHESIQLSEYARKHRNIL